MRRQDIKAYAFHTYIFKPPKYEGLKSRYELIVVVVVVVIIIIIIISVKIFGADKSADKKV
jgi:hypothetical protein